MRNRRPVRLATAVAAAVLSGCALASALDRVPAGAGSNSGPDSRAAAPGPSGPILDLKPATTGAIGNKTSKTNGTLALTAPAASPPGAAQAEQARAYLFRGALGPIFSRGIDTLTERIAQAGITASVNEFTVCRYIAEQAIRDYRQKPAPIALIGHSMGGRCALEFAELLQAENIPVSLVVTIDPAQLMPKVPFNVERYINIFLSNDVLGGGDVKPEQGYQGHFASFDLSKLAGVLHVNIDKMNTLHNQLVAKVQQLAATPAKLEGEGVPLRYVVPRDAPVELWDSGVPVTVRPGETLETIAATYQVPVWSIRPINPAPENAPPAANQRVVVPRHLVPAVAVVLPRPRP